MSRKLLLNLAETPQKYTTPCMLIGTRNGTIPHLTRETWDFVESGLPSPSCHPPAFLIPFCTWAAKRDILKSYGKGLAKFMGFEDKPMIMTTMDPSEPNKAGFHRNKYISVWHNGNRESVEPEIYMDGAEQSQINAVFTLSDGETPKDSSNKRISKSVSKTLDFLDICIRKKEEKNLKCNIFAPIEGGYDLNARLHSAKKTNERNLDLDGYFLDGFHMNGKDSLNIDTVEVKSILKQVLPLLSESKPRIYFGSCDPIMTLDLIEMGIDVFESSYAYHTTGEGKALVFPNRIANQQTVHNEGINEEQDADTPPKVVNYSLDLNDKSFKEDFSPISKSCSCYTCRKHTRGYINHLLVTDELLGPVLLMIHNLHHLLIFFDTIRNCIGEDGKLDELRNMINK